MNIGIIDADLVGRRKHRFPNLVSMKISSFYKNLGNNVKLITEYTSELSKYDRLFLSKVFTDTQVPSWVINLSNIKYGGTGFNYDNAEPLPCKIEHCMPDYNLYDNWIQQQLKKGRKEKEFEYYTKYSIGFMTRGCIRQCSFCVNKNYKICIRHSNVSEFLDKNKPYVCLLDDNVLACKDWRSIFKELQDTGKRFQFKQGLDERLLTEESTKLIFKDSKWIGDYIFAFDNINDREIIERKLRLIRHYTDSKTIKFYVFCAYNHKNIGVYDEKFWVNDIVDLFKRIEILKTYNCRPYIMRYKDYELSPYRGIYINVASWCNQPRLFTKMTFEEFSRLRGMSYKNYKIYKMDIKKYLEDGNKKGSSWRYYDEFATKHPEVAEKYFK